MLFINNDHKEKNNAYRYLYLSQFNFQLQENNVYTEVKYCLV